MIEAGDLVDTLVITVASLADGSDEILVVDGQAIELTHLNNETTATGGYDISVTLSGNTATVTITKTGGYTTAAAATIRRTRLQQHQRRPARCGPSGHVVLGQGRRRNGQWWQRHTGIAIASLVSITPVNDAPAVATNVGSTVLEGSTGNTITTAMLNEGDVDDDGAGLT